MALSKQDCKLLRVLVNRSTMLDLGPQWFTDEPSDPRLSALHAELRHQTREWLRTNIAKEVQSMLPRDERVRGV